MGRATAHLFADEGARVAVVDRDAAGVSRVVEEIEKAGGTAAGFPLDVSDTAQIVALAREVRERLGRSTS
jgi:3-oxoacyl-[acyl-carrier protein] reductase